MNTSIIVKSAPPALCNSSSSVPTTPVPAVKSKCTKEITVKLPKDNFILKPQEQEAVFGSIDSYRIIGLFGSGAYSRVFKSISETENKEVAVKAFKLLHKNANLTKNLYIEEISIINHLMEEDHGNIVRFLDISRTHCAFFMEFANSKTLFDISTGINRYPWENDEGGSTIVLTGLIHGLEYLQRVKIVHRDLNACNILVEGNVQKQDFVVKIADFGRAIFLGTDIEIPVEQCAPYPYCPPETIFADWPRDYQVDIWALGVILYFMIPGGHPYHNFKRFYENMNKIHLKEMADDTEEEYPHRMYFKTIIENTLVIDPSQRWSLDQILDIPFVAMHYSLTKKPIKYRDNRPFFDVSKF